MTQGDPVIKEENVKIGEDNFNRSLPTLFDDVAGLYDLMEHESNECKLGFPLFNLNY